MSIRTIQTNGTLSAGETGIVNQAIDGLKAIVMSDDQVADSTTVKASVAMYATGAFALGSWFARKRASEGKPPFLGVFA